MMKYTATIGFCTGLLLLGLAISTTSGGGAVEARENAPVCEIKPILLDEGYGVSRVELRNVCLQAP